MDANQAEDVELSEREAYELHAIADARNDAHAVWLFVKFTILDKLRAIFRRKDENKSSEKG